MLRLEKMLNLTCTSNAITMLSRIKSTTNNVRELSSDKPAVVLGIETSCDDTGCAIVDSDGRILGEALHSQQITHLDNGGIIPPVARELHRQHITDVVEKSLRSANMRLRDVDAIATTTKPGLALSLLIGTNFGKYLSRIGNKPFIPIHHMEAHALTARMVEKVEYPFLVLLISGGHCLLALVKSVDKYLLLGKSIDDAPGEAFDKTARRLRLRNIPEFRDLAGGAAMELAASRASNPEQFRFQLPLQHYADCNFSLAGLKHAALRHILTQEKNYQIKPDEIIPDLYNLCAGFQRTLTKHLCHRTQRAMEFLEKRSLIQETNKTLVVSGGAACNNFIAKSLEKVCAEMGYRFARPPPKLCTDNGVMIAWNGLERWIADAGVLRERAEIERVDIEPRSSFGEDWCREVANESIRSKKIKLPPHEQVAD